MPWYYAGPEAKPVGPVTLEELTALRARGAIAPETYVIEEKGQGMAGLAWKRYQELFPDVASLPPLPPAPPAAYLPPPIPPVAPPPVMQAHPLFPSAAPTPAQPSFPPAAPPVFRPAAGPVFTGDGYVGGPDPYYRNHKPTNAWCAWGFGLGLAAFCFSFLCGVGLFPALLSIPLCIVGLMKLHKHREQAGQWLAIWGLVLSGLTLIVVAVFAIKLAMPILKAHGLTVTEETSNDSE